MCCATHLVGNGTSADGAKDGAERQQSGESTLASGRKSTNARGVTGAETLLEVVHVKLEELVSASRPWHAHTTRPASGFHCTYQDTSLRVSPTEDDSSERLEQA